MRTFNFISAIFMVFLFLSCSAEQQQDVQEKLKEPELISVGLNMGGELNVSQEPLKTQETAKADLFGIQVYDSGGQPYAFVVGDDLSQITLDLPENQAYTVKATYVKDAKNLMNYREEEQEWGWPFATDGRTGTVINKVYYTSSNELFLLAHATVDSKAAGIYDEVDRYYGYIENFTPTAENNQIRINLKRMIFGLKLRLELEDPDVENIRFSIAGGGEYVIPVIEGVASLVIPYLTLVIPECESCNIALEFALAADYEEDISISIGTLDHHTRYFDGSITVKRNKMMVINHSLEEGESLPSGFQVDFEEGEMQEEVVVINSGQ